MIPTLIDSLDFTQLSFQFNDSLISTPRNIITCTLNICVFFILIFISDNYARPNNNMQLVLATFRDNLLIENHNCNIYIVCSIQYFQAVLYHCLNRRCSCHQHHSGQVLTLVELHVLFFVCLSCSHQCLQIGYDCSSN